MDLPTVYRFPGDDESYMIGSEVGSRLDLFKGALYKKFPNLWRRIVTKDEKKILSELGVSNRVLANWELMCIRASDGEAILRGDGQQFKGPGGTKSRGSVVPIKKTCLQNQSHGTANPVKALRGEGTEVHLAPLINSCVSTQHQIKPKKLKRRAALRDLIMPKWYDMIFLIYANPMKTAANKLYKRKLILSWREDEEFFKFSF